MRGALAKTCPEDKTLESHFSRVKANPLPRCRTYSTSKVDRKVVFEKERVNYIWIKIEEADSITVDHFLQEVSEMIKLIDKFSS